MNKLFKQAKKDDAVHEVSALFFAIVRRSLPSGMPSKNYWGGFVLASVGQAVSKGVEPTAESQARRVVPGAPL